jgi:hypothetical protein
VIAIIPALRALRVLKSAFDTNNPWSARRSRLRRAGGLLVGDDADRRAPPTGTSDSWAAEAAPSSPASSDDGPRPKLVEAEGASLGLQEPWHFFWATGSLSSVLDNAPTYLTFTALGTAVVNAADPGAGLTVDQLAPFAAHPAGAPLLAAISCGAVFMGAMTYIGNGPNFMVKAIAEESRVKMPSFFGYMAWSAAVLIPLFAILTLVWFRG